MVALPFSTANICVSRPKSERYPKQLVTIGDHIRAWRIDNNLSQADIAERLCVCEDTITGWEIRRINPTAKQMPGIIQLIGYLPIEIDTSTIGGRITLYRYTHGLSPKEFGFLLSADASTVRAWESGENTPHKKRIKEIEEIIHDDKIRLNAV